MRHQNSIKCHQRPSAPNDRFDERGAEKEPLVNYFDGDGQPLHFVQHTRHTLATTAGGGRSAAEAFHQAPASDLKPHLRGAGGGGDTDALAGVFDYEGQAKTVHRHRQKGHKNTNDALPTEEFEECHLSDLDRDSPAFNIDDIQCPGCRQAVAHEVLLQQR
ncbi:unnamed protein product [Dibothriocephalus latus]|uniref:Uncharacterized protein n=1 Tax=Dibothriocephalus latus TaxID=60516 RepID=A0A3P7LUS6_DIBLA|nr:unnamed protein product [Dibothriocephalus latus]